MRATATIPNRVRRSGTQTPRSGSDRRHTPEPEGWWATRGWMVWCVVGFVVILALAWIFGGGHTAGAFTQTVEGWQETNRSMP